MHSELSPDGSLSERDFRLAFNSGMLHTAVITDHDEISRALELQEVFRDKIIVGEEITTSQGEIIGLYLSKRIEPRMTASETIQAIRKQNGIVYIPHPFETARKGVTLETLNSVAHGVDIIEVVNGRAFSLKARKLAVQWALQNNVMQAASSDAHGRKGWGRVYTELPQAPTRNTLLELMSEGILQGDRNGLVSYAYPKLNRLRKSLKK